MMDNNEPVNVVAMSGTGNGTVHSETPGFNNPNLIVTYISPLVGILIKGLKAFLGSFIGGGLMGTLSMSDVSHLVENTLSFATGTALAVMIGALVSYLGELEKKFPIIGA